VIYSWQDWTFMARVQKFQTLRPAIRPTSANRS
jgi:hypothetical protein